MGGVGSGKLSVGSCEMMLMEVVEGVLEAAAPECMVSGACRQGCGELARGLSSPCLLPDPVLEMFPDD